ncbi:DUF2088 domain-containing protein [Effusibacillus consociatus]|uniref:DUF2088 domain-containing protein n=1 Tax=Effusibacillus consociatus TaxID=1117041 RepID=A0ABV9PXN0_9BACL
MGQLILHKVEQRFHAPRLSDVAGKARSELQRISANLDLNGKRVAVTAGSRGIQNIVLILQTVLGFLKEKGAEPCIVPAMGSHGGGTVEGQLNMLASLGITEETIGFPIKPTIEVVEVGRYKDIPVYQNRNAFESDAIVVVNRVKTHTSFKSKLESGLSKMLVVGLGNPAGAANIHRFGIEGMKTLIEPMASMILDKTPVCCGLVIIENAEEATADIVGVLPGEWIDKEAGLLIESKSLMPSLPFRNIDLLIVEEMGKCYSGTGMDTNVIGRVRIHDTEDPNNPYIKRIAVLDLAESSHGNATGIGLADITTRKLVDKIDLHATYLNVMSSTFVLRAMIPMTAPNEEKAVGWAIRSFGEVDVNQLRIVRIANTLHLQHLWVSEALLSEVEALSHVAKLQESRIIEYDTSM